MKRIKAILVVVATFLVMVVGITGWEVYQMKKAAGSMKTSIVTMVSCLKIGDVSGASVAYDAACSSASVISSSLSHPNWFWFSYGRELIGIWDSMSYSVISPGLEVVSSYPLSSLKADDGINVVAVSAYLEFLESCDAEISDCFERLSGLSPFMNSLLGIDEYIEKIDSLSSTYSSAKKYIPLVKAFLGSGEDRTYLFAAQNSSEIRASGGFPGSVSVIRIRNGVLTIGDFSTVSDYLPLRMPSSCGVTASENALFGGWLTLQRDACYIPDFERVGYMWKLGYEEMNGEELDGVVTAVPAIVQKMLSFLGSVTLSDGRVLDGTNAVKVIEKDIYYDYFKKSNYTSLSNEITDGLFSEAAKKTFDLALSSFSLEQADDYLDMFEDSFANREIMIWMADDEEQSVVRSLGCSGALNYDKNSPLAGVYYSCCDPGRLGLFIRMDTSMSKGVKNADGSMTYDVTVTFNNAIDSEIVQTAISYIVGNYNGAILSYVHLFAPCGGSISSVSASNGMTFKETEYDNLQVFYALNFFVYPGEEITITYKVTTAPGVTTPLKFDKTPLLQEYLDD